MSKEFYSKLAEIQKTLNAPKNQYNSFGKYKYRNCEDILEAVKPLLNGLFLTISDEIVLIGERYYVKSTATVTDGETSHTATALAREEEIKKGMDSAQITGATSSYARKYCLNGLFGIDDAKDADTDEHKRQQQRPQQQVKQEPSINADEILSRFIDKVNVMSSKELQAAYEWSAKKLANFPDHHQKLNQAYNSRKSALVASV